MRVAIVTESDFAGSGYFASQAIAEEQKSPAAFCRHIAYWAHPWGLPGDIITRDPKELEGIFNRTDVVHLWNILPDNRVIDRLKVPKDKIKSITMTGSLYRKEHERCNELIQKHNLKLVIQNPCFSDHTDATFIQHSLPIGFKRHQLKRQQLIGLYDKHNGRGQPSETTTGHKDAMFVKENIKSMDGWGVALEGPPIMWEDRIKELSRCSLFFEYFDKKMGYWGRSTLEACALGVVPLTWWRPEMLNGITPPPFPRVTEKTVMDDIHYAIEHWETLARECYKWVYENYSPAIVGQKYIDFFVSNNHKE